MLNLFLRPLQDEFFPDILSYMDFSTDHERHKFLELDQNFSRIFAIGDIHGCLSETELLLNHLQNELSVGEDDLVVFIGDYVDRGPNSKEVVEMLLSFKRSVPNTLFLRGNHEEMLLSYLGCSGETRMGKSYLYNGGESTLLSYGVPEDEFENALEHIPAGHVSFFLATERYVILPKFVFAHAGLNPLRDLRAQLDEDLLWIRDEFIKNVHYFERVVVFGHTPYQEVMFNFPYKIGIDTGLVYGNALSCIELCEGKILRIEQAAKEVKTIDFPQAKSPLNHA